MTKKILIDSDPWEDRIALLEGGRLVEIRIEQRDRRGLAGNIYLGRVSRWVAGLQAAFIDIGVERDAYLFVDEPEDDTVDAQDREGLPEGTLEPFHKGQQVLVQITRNSVRNKGARVTDRISLPGRNIVLLPEGKGIGISRQIVKLEERERLLGLMEAHDPEKGGVIVRTAGRGRDGAVLEAEIESLGKLWDSIRQAAAVLEAPARVHRDLDLPRRALRDLLDETIEEVIVDGESCHEDLSSFLAATEPELADRLRLSDTPGELFGLHGVEAEIDKLIRRKVWLKSGGFICIDPTEALVAIDVNTGRNLGSNRLEETALETNLEAASEVARQIRLRDLGGILVVDFIDMTEPENRARVLEALEQAMSGDRSRSQISDMSEFCLVQMTRKRTNQNIESELTSTCPCCHGGGRVKSAQTVAHEAFREAVARGASLAGRNVSLRVNPRTAEVLSKEAGDLLARASVELGVRFAVEADAGLGLEDFELVVER